MKLRQNILVLVATITNFIIAGTIFGQTFIVKKGFAGLKPELIKTILVIILLVAMAALIFKHFMDSRHYWQYLRRKEIIKTKQVIAEILFWSGLMVVMLYNISSMWLKKFAGYIRPVFFFGIVCLLIGSIISLYSFHKQGKEQEQ